MANCPNCGTRQQLIDAHLAQTRAEICPRCLGAWLTPQDITRISGKGFTPLVDLIKEGWGAAPDYSVVIQHNLRICPRCAQGLQRGEFAMNSAVQCDRCPKGHGTWIDFLELNAIADYLARIGKQTFELGARKQGFLGGLKRVVFRLFNPGN